MVGGWLVTTAIAVVFGVEGWVAEAHHGEGVTAGALAAEVVVVVDHQSAVIAQGEAFWFVVAERAAHGGQVEQLHLAGQLDAGGGEAIGTGDTKDRWGGGVAVVVHQGAGVVEQLRARQTDGISPAGCASGASLGCGHHDQLTHLNLAGGRSHCLVDLISHQEIAELAGVVTADTCEEGRYIDDPGGFLVEGERIATGEQGRIMLGQLHQGVGAWVVAPDLGEAGVVAGIFLQQDRAVISHGHVVEHHLALAAIEQHLHRAAGLWIGGIGEFQGPEAAGTGAGGGGNEVESFAVLAPGAIFGAQPVGHTRRDALAVECGAGLGLYIAEIHQFKATDAIAQAEAGVVRVSEAAHLGVSGASGVDANAVGGAIG